MSCPPLIELSQLVDAELPSADMRRVEQHVQSCAACARSVADLEALAWPPTRPQHAMPGASCPNDESLLAWLTSAPTATVAIDTHLAACDPCTQRVQELQRVRGALPEMETMVPARIREQATAWARPQPAMPSLWERLSAALRYPVLMPAAFATGMLLYVVAQQLPDPSGLPVAGSRSVQQPGAVTRQVIAAEASVYAEASRRADIVERLTRGAVVEISSEERGWYRVTLADGREGWIEQSSLQ